MKNKVFEAVIGEGERVCDRCGHTDKADRFVSIYYGIYGEKVDLCPTCVGRGPIVISARRGKRGGVFKCLKELL